MLIHPKTFQANIGGQEYSTSDRSTRSKENICQKRWILFSFLGSIRVAVFCDGKNFELKIREPDSHNYYEPIGVCVCMLISAALEVKKKIHFALLCSYIWDICLLDL